MTALLSIKDIVSIMMTSISYNGVKLSKENFLSHQWTMLSKDKDFLLFSCDRCNFACGIVYEDKKYKMLGLSNISCSEMNWKDLLQ